MPAYYNEIDPYCADWLRNLIGAGHIAPGEVDTRSIVEVRPDDLKGYDQCHFFAGIGGWSLALRLADWDDARPAWTGSCPCQPFSAAGKGKAADDERHLAPAWLSLVAECRPGIVFGEQVEAAIGWGWLDFVFDALEKENYACAATVLPACGVGAPHIRQRVYFVGERLDDSAGARSVASRERTEAAARDKARLRGPECGRGARELADPGSERRQQIGRGAPGDEGAHGRRQEGDHLAASDGENSMADANRRRLGRPEVSVRPARQDQTEAHERGRDDRMADTELPGTARLGANSRKGEAEGRLRGGSANSSVLGDANKERHEGSATRPRAGRRHGAAEPGRLGFWSDIIWLPCRDGKARPTKSGIQPLAHGVPARVGKLRAAGNAISPQVAEAFIRACDMRFITGSS